MNYKTFMRVMMAIALLFAVQDNASAQFGGLMKKAKDAAKKKVEKTVDEATGNSSTTTTTTTTDANTGATSNAGAGNSNDNSTDMDKVMADYRADHPAAMEKYNADKAGGMDKYLGLDQTESGKIIYKYSIMEYGEGGDNSSNRANARGAASTLVNLLRYLKGNTETFAGFDQPAHVLDVLNNQVPNQIKAMAATGNYKKPLPKAEIDAFKSECARIKQLYMSQTGTKEKSADEKKAEADAEYIKNIVSQNYLLNDLTDRNRQAKAVADYKAKINAKVKAQLAPTKILGTYSTSPAWQGLPIFQMPELKEKYKSVQEMQFKTFYEKGGKYYVVKGAFRQSIPKGDEVHGAQPQKDSWPGLETPVEVPAEKIQGVKF